MIELIMIRPNYRMGFGDDIESSPATFAIGYIRLNSQKAADKLLSGEPMTSLSSEDIAIQGEVLAPNGAVPEAFAMGSSAIESLDEALSVVARALKNQNGVLQANGFGGDTPVYVWRLGKSASPVIPPTDAE